MSAATTESVENTGSDHPDRPEPSDARRFIAGRAFKGRRVHVFYDTAITSRAFARHALCAGLRPKVVATTADTREWPDDPFEIPITERAVTCARCWDRYERHLIAAVTPTEIAKELP